MNESHEQFQQVFNELFSLTIPNKIKFIDTLLCYFTIAGRAIWSDEKQTDAEKVEAFKWLNELLHRTWNIRYELQQNEDNNSIKKLYDNMRFYGERSPLLAAQLVPTVSGAFKIFIGMHGGK